MLSVVCTCKIEDEIHFLVECPLYHTLRERLLLACSEFTQFDGRSILEKFVAVMSDHLSDDDVVVIRALTDYSWRSAVIH
jgi:hypothetical protein